MLLLDNGEIKASGKMSEIFTALDLPMAHQSRAESIIKASVSHYDEEFGIASVAFLGGQFSVAAEPLIVGSKVRLQVLARDVSITLEPQKNTSILNIIPVTIDAIAKESKSQMTVRLIADETVLLSRITCKSAYNLNLKEGDKVYAQVKTAALLT